MDTTGQAAVYVNGVLRTKVEDGDENKRHTDTTPIYLAQTQHELVVRYMSHEPGRNMKISLAFRDDPLRPLEEGLTSGKCQ